MRLTCRFASAAFALLACGKVSAQMPQALRPGAIMHVVGSTADACPDPSALLQAKRLIAAGRHDLALEMEADNHCTTLLGADMLKAPQKIVLAYPEDEYSLVLVEPNTYYEMAMFVDNSLIVDKDGRHPGSQAHRDWTGLPPVNLVIQHWKDH